MEKVFFLETIFQKALFIHKQLSRKSSKPSRPKKPQIKLDQVVITLPPMVRFVECTVKRTDNIIFTFSEFLSYGLGNPPSCDQNCKFLWDGFGRWYNGTWRPHVKGECERRSSEKANNIVDIKFDSEQYSSF